eukprot:3918406-Heterocapsa_arctica.AAC.1
MLVNWIRQAEGGLHTDTKSNWDKYDIHTGQVRGPINNFIIIVKEPNWIDNSPTNITDHMG